MFVLLDGDDEGRKVYNHIKDTDESIELKMATYPNNIKPTKKINY